MFDSLDDIIIQTMLICGEVSFEIYTFSNEKKKIEIAWHFITINCVRFEIYMT